MPRLSHIPLKQGITWDTSNKSVPNSTFLKFSRDQIYSHYNNRVEKMKKVVLLKALLNPKTSITLPRG